MKIVITGDEGFIGKRIKKSLQEHSGIEVIGLDIRNGYDVCKFNAIHELEKFDILIHLASLNFVPDSFKKPRIYYESNIISTINVLELCRLNNAKIIFMSSYVYGQPEYLPIDENHPLKAFNPYAQSKIIGEKLCEGYHRDFGIPCIILRPFNIYGDGQNELFLLPSIIKQIKEGKKKIQLNDPIPRRDFVYIDDVVEAIEKSTLSLVNGDTFIRNYNIATGISYSVREITEIIKSFGKPFSDLEFTFNIDEIRRNEVNETTGSYKKINNEIGWEPGITLTEGLKKWLETV